MTIKQFIDALLFAFCIAAPFAAYFIIYGG